MERKTYYMILGVSSTESDRGIRSAYRDLAKRLHPDVAGEQATRSFQEISEAYSVLSDPQRRREYNHGLSGAERYCQQRGMIESEERLRIRIPPRAPSGSIFEIPLRGLGIHNFCLRLHVFVEAQPG